MLPCSLDLDYMLASPLSGLGSAARGPPSCSSTEIDDLGAEEQGGDSLLDAEGRALPSPDGTEASPGGEDLDGVGTGKEEELALGREGLMWGHEIGRAHV